MGLKPAFRVIANDADITETVRKRLRQIRVTDETGVTSDTLEITLADHDPADRLRLPPTGAELEVFLGYDELVRRMGLFVVDEIELSGPPSEMVIRARAAPYEASKGGRIDWQTQKTRSWPAGTTLGAMVRKLAAEHRMTPAIAAKLGSIALPHTDQTGESDMNLLHRIAARYDAVAKPAGGRLVVVARGGAATASGAAMPRMVFTPGDGSSYRVTLASRDRAGTCIAYYRDVRKGERRFVKVGEGEPVRRLRMAYPDQASAEAAARAKQRTRARGQRALAFSFPGRADVIAEAIVTMQGFGEGVDGDWLVTRAEHLFGPNGYRCTIEGEQPNSAANDDTAEEGVEEATVTDSAT